MGSGVGRLATRRPGLLLLAAPVIVAALALMALGAGLAEFVADSSGLALHVPTWFTGEVAVWTVALVVVGFVLVRVQRHCGTVRAWLALGVLMGVALFAMTVGELVAYFGGHGW